jgi:hypothetical protein
MCRTTIFSVSLALLVGLVTSSANGEFITAVWGLDEGSGIQALDSAGPPFHDGILKGGVSWAGAGAPAGRNPANAFYFDGVETGYHETDPGNVNWVDAGTFDVVGPGLTMAAWIKPESFAIGDARVINKGKSWSSADIWWMLSTIGDGTGLRMRLKTDDGGPDAGTTTLASANGFLEADKWQHVAGTYDGSMMRLWLWKPGDTFHTEIASTAKTGTIEVDPTVIVAIGNNGPGLPGGLSKTFHGAIDDVRVYSDALDQAELRTLVPEPATTALLGMGGVALAGLALLRRRRAA